MDKCSGMTMPASNDEGLAFWKPIFEISSDAFLLLDNSLHILRFNPSASHLFGTTTLEQKAIAELVHWRDSDRLKDYLLSLSEASVASIEIQIRRAGNRITAVKLKANRVLVSDNPFFLCVIVDITQRRRGMYLADQQKRLSYLTNAILDNLCYDMRNPLNTIIGLSEILCERLHRHEIAEEADYVDYIHKESKRLLNVIDNLLDVRDIQDHPELILEKFQPGSLLEAMFTMMVRQSERRQIRLRYDLDPDLPEMYADISAIKRIIYELLDNSIRFGIRGSEIFIRVSHGTDNDQRHQVFIDLEDDRGLLVSALLDQNRRHHVLPPGVSPGYGLLPFGLPMVQMLVSMQGGRVERLSEDDQEWLRLSLPVRVTPATLWKPVNNAIYYASEKAIPFTIMTLQWTTNGHSISAGRLAEVVENLYGVVRRKNDQVVQINANTIAVILMDSDTNGAFQVWERLCRFGNGNIDQRSSLNNAIRAHAMFPDDGTHYEDLVLNLNRQLPNPLH